MIERYQTMLTPDDMEQLQQALQRPLYPALRINTLKAHPHTDLHIWAELYGWQMQPVPFCPTGWQITAHGETLGRLLEHRMGFYYIQDASSMLPAELFDFTDMPSPLILDMAASPGGKTTHLVDRIHDQGLIIANDSSKARVGALRTNIQDWGAFSTAITNYPGETLGQWYPDCFDAVLLDAPCSGESLRTAERHKMRFVSAKERQALHRRQVGLLNSAFHALRPGGQVVYATCTLAPEENEAVLEAFLKRYIHQATLEAINHILPKPAPGLMSHGEHIFPPQVRHAIRLWPHLYDTTGFFAALIRKHDSVLVQHLPPPTRSFEQAGLTHVSDREQTMLLDHLATVYAIDLYPIIEQYALSLWKRQQAFYAFPEQFVAQFGHLPTVAIGMLLGEYVDNHFVPSHELVSRFSRYCNTPRLTLSSTQAAIWLSGRDLRGVDLPIPTANAPIVVLEDSRQRFLGRGKVLPDRIRNMLPKRVMQ